MVAFLKVVCRAGVMLELVKHEDMAAWDDVRAQWSKQPGSDSPIVPEALAVLLHTR